MSPAGRALVFVLLCAVAPGSPGEASRVECAQDIPGVREIREVAEGIIAADNAGEIESVMHFYAPEAVLMPPGDTAVAGVDRIRPRYESLFAEFTPAIELHVEEACVDGRLGFVRGWNGGRLTSRASGEVVLLDDVFLMLLRPDAGGSWRITHLIWHRRSEQRVRDGVD